MTEHRTPPVQEPARSRIGRWALAGALVLVAMGVIGLGARKLPGSGSTRDPVIINFDLQQALTNFFLTAGAIVGFVAIVVIFWPSQEAPELPRRSLAKYVLGPLGILVGVGLLVLAFRGDPEPPVQSPTPRTVADVVPETPGGDTPVWGFYVLVGAFGVALLAIGRRARSPAPPSDPESEQTDLDVEAFLELPDDLVSGDEPRSQVIRAYVEMIRAFAGHQLPRLASETPREFVDRALRRVEGARPPAVRLTRLFEFARFSLHPITAAEAEEARAAMTAVQHELDHAL